MNYFAKNDINKLSIADLVFIKFIIYSYIFVLFKKEIPFFQFIKKKKTFFVFIDSLLLFFHQLKSFINFFFFFIFILSFDIFSDVYHWEMMKVMIMDETKNERQRDTNLFIAERSLLK